LTEEVGCIFQLSPLAVWRSSVAERIRP
jgi:hypothetical protein